MIKYKINEMLPVENMLQHL